MLEKQPAALTVAIWNGIPGQSPVKKFQDRKKAVVRIWKAIQPLAGQPTPAAAQKSEPKAKTSKPAKKGKVAKEKARKATGDKASDRNNKKAEVIVMMRRVKCATLAEIMEWTG